MRIRSIKPEFWTHRIQRCISEPAALLAAALICYPDDEGRFEADPATMRRELFPRRDLSIPIEQALAELEKVGFIQLYDGRLDGQETRIGQVVNFRRHQRISNPTKSRLPACQNGAVSNDDSTPTPQSLHTDSTPTPQSLHTDSTPTPQSLHTDSTPTPQSLHTDSTPTPQSLHTDSTPTPQSLHTDSTGKDGRIGEDGRMDGGSEPQGTRPVPFPTLEEAQKFAHAKKLPPDCAQKFWFEMEAAAWIGLNGRPIANWRAMLQAYAIAWKKIAAQNEARNGGHHPAPDDDPEWWSRPLAWCEDEVLMLFAAGTAGAKARCGRLREIIAQRQLPRGTGRPDVNTQANDTQPNL